MEDFDKLPEKLLMPGLEQLEKSIIASMFNDENSIHIVFKLLFV